MSREQDKNNLPYLKCILCGKEIREERKFEKTGENAPKRQRFEANAKKIDENKGSKTAIKSNKWQFTQS